MWCSPQNCMQTTHRTLIRWKNVGLSRAVAGRRTTCESAVPLPNRGFSFKRWRIKLCRKPVDTWQIWLHAKIRNIPCLLNRSSHEMCAFIQPAAHCRATPPHPYHPPAPEPRRAWMSSHPDTTLLAGSKMLSENLCQRRREEASGSERKCIPTRSCRKSFEFVLEL